MKAQVQRKQTKAVVAGSTPRQALAGIQVFSKPDELQGAVVRQPFRLGSRKGRFFQSFHVGLLILLLVFIGRDELRAQTVSVHPASGGGYWHLSPSDYHARRAGSLPDAAADSLYLLRRTDLPSARFPTGQDVPSELLNAKPRHFLPCSTLHKYLYSAHPAAAWTAWQSNC